MKKNSFSENLSLQGERVTLRRLGSEDADGLRELMENPLVYRYLPTFLFEKNHGSAEEVIRRLYDGSQEESLILGIFVEKRFCGLIELYGFRDDIHKVSVGYRLLEKCWGQGIATEALGLLVRTLVEETDIEIITASTMIENRASANVLKKSGFRLTEQHVEEDWGYDAPTLADKWAHCELSSRFPG